MNPKLEDLQRLRLGGMSPDKIAQLYGLPYKAVTHALNGLCKQVELDRLPKAETEDQEAVRLYKSGQTIREIAQMQNRAPGSIRRLMSHTNTLKHKSKDSGKPEPNTPECDQQND